MNTVESAVVDLAISADQFQRLYTGSASSVVAQARDGRRISFPARILRRFVTHAGIYGSFRIEFDGANRFKQIVKLDN